MRGVFVGLAFVLSAAMWTPTPALAAPLSGHHALAVVAVQDVQAQSKDVKVDINVNRGGAGVWYRSPVWIAIGALAFIILLVVIVFAARGGGTTIVKE